MSEEDLDNFLRGIGGDGDFRSYMQGIIDRYLIIMVYFTDNTNITIGSGGIRKSRVACLNKALEVQYDSHKTDYLYDSIVRIEKYG